MSTEMKYFPTTVRAEKKYFHDLLEILDFNNQFKANYNANFEKALAGDFAMSAEGLAVLKEYLDDATIKKILRVVAVHRDLIRPFLRNRSTAAEISQKLFTVQGQSEQLFDSLQTLDIDSRARLSAELGKRNFYIDFEQLSRDLTMLSAIAKFTGKTTPQTAGAGIRRRGQRPIPDALLVSKIADILSAKNVNTTTDAIGSVFVKICQAISDSGGSGFESNDVRGPIRAYINRRM